MPKARNRWERAVQVFRWAQATYELPSDTGFELVPDIDRGKTFGQLILRGDRYVIQLSARACRTTHDAVYNTLHECAHLKLQEKGLGDAHGPYFWKTFGRMVDDYDAHGNVDSEAFEKE